MSELTGAGEFYTDPTNLVPTGPPRRPRRRQLTSHVPVRFSPATVAAVRMLAWRDGISMSSWIRSAVEREVERQLPRLLTAGTQTAPLKLAAQETLNPYSYLNKTPELTPAV